MIMHARTNTYVYEGYMMTVSRSDNYSYRFESCVRGDKGVVLDKGPKRLGRR